MRILFILLFSFFCFIPTITAEIKEEAVSYAADGVSMKGYLAFDSAVSGKRPGVLVVHEWWGLNQYAKKRARMLAELGYTALALDMYGEGKVATHPDTAKSFAGAVRNDMDGAEKRFAAALSLLKAHPTTDPGNLAAIGYCFGGGLLLELARRGVDLAGVASFHGSLATKHPAKDGHIKPAILVCNGASDPFVPEKSITAFKTEMEQAGVDYQFISYPDAKHSFTNPDADKWGAEFNLPLAYNEAADKSSWNSLENFLQKVFKKN